MPGVCFPARGSSSRPPFATALPRQPFRDSPSATALLRQPFCKERLSLWSGFRSWGREPEGSSAETFKLPVRVSARRAPAPQTPVLQALAPLLLRDQDGDASQLSWRAAAPLAAFLKAVREPRERVVGNHLLDAGDLASGDEHNLQVRLDAPLSAEGAFVFPATPFRLLVCNPELTKGGP
jgi:hypothetical protein